MTERLHTPSCQRPAGPQPATRTMRQPRHKEKEGSAMETPGETDVRNGNVALLPARECHELPGIRDADGGHL